MTSDPVNHPSHYTSGAVECIDAIEAAMTFEEFVGFLRGQMIKYVWRAGKKNDAREDIEKALWYGNRLAARLAAEQEAVDAAHEEAVLTMGTLSSAFLEEAQESWKAAINRDIDAMLAKEAELRKLSHLEDTDGNVVLMYTDHVNWDEAPEWANFLGYDAPDDTPDGRVARAYWFENRPGWLAKSGYWASGGQGGRIQYAEPYSGQGGDPRLFVRASG